MCVYLCKSVLPDGWGVVRGPGLVQKHSVGQVLVEVSTLHVLGDHAERVAADAHTKQPDDIRVLQARQDLHLFEEIVPDGERREAGRIRCVSERGGGSEHDQI